MNKKERSTLEGVDYEKANGRKVFFFFLSVYSQYQIGPIGSWSIGEFNNDRYVSLRYLILMVAHSTDGDPAH